MKLINKAGYENRDFDLLPNGKRFCFWEDTTKYNKVLHVAINNPDASDENPGSMERPLKTINAAAHLLQPGEKAIVHEGVYRECVRPARGGLSADNMIMYEAADGERVVIKGSEIWNPVFVKSAGWRLGNSDPSIAIVMADIPETFFQAYNPFLARNVYHYLIQYGRPNEPEWMKKAMLYRGSVFIDGQPMKQVYSYTDLSTDTNTFWVEQPGLRLHLRLPEDKDLDKCVFEVTVREQVFAPKTHGLGFVRVKGFHIEHGADGLPVPQRAALSAMRGHNWIIENNHLEWINSCAIDIGGESWDAQPNKNTDTEVLVGHHIVRNNVIRNVGICGIAGVGNVDETLVENNLIEEIGYLDLEHMSENAGMKFHVCTDLLIRNNIIRHISHACGIWLDCEAENCRITNNVIADIQTVIGGVFMEMDFKENMIDHNIFWDIRNDPPETDKSIYPTSKWEYANGTAIRSDCNEKLIVAYNLFGNMKEHAVSLNIMQNKRLMHGRTGICLANKVIGNIFYDCPNRIYLANKLQNEIDCNLYDKNNDDTSFMLVFPEPHTVQNLEGWQECFGFDNNSKQIGIEAKFDMETCVLEMEIKNDEAALSSSDSQTDTTYQDVITGIFAEEAIKISEQTFKIRQKYDFGIKLL